MIRIVAQLISWHIVSTFPSKFFVFMLNFSHEAASCQYVGPVSLFFFVFSSGCFVPQKVMLFSVLSNLCHPDASTINIVLDLMK